MTTPTRLDVWMAERGLTESRSRAQALIMAGRVLVDGAVVTKAGTAVPAGAAVELVAPPRFVSRGGEKLETAIETFAVDPAGSAASTSVRRPAVSPTACCSTAPRTWWRSTWAETSSTSGCGPTRG